MAIILREPRNPLADALGTLSQQILADAASRKEREFRSAEMEKERAFMGSENAATRALQQSQNEAHMKYLTQVAADTRLSEQERIAAMRELGVLEANVQREVGLADAGARGAQGEALLEEARGRTKLIEGELEGKRMLTGLLLESLGYSPDGKGGFVRNFVSPSSANAGIVKIPQRTREAARNLGYNLPSAMTVDDLNSTIEEVNPGMFSSFFKGQGSPIGAAATAGSTLAGAGVGSVVPGLGTAIGAGVGYLGGGIGTGIDYYNRSQDLVRTLEGLADTGTESLLAGRESAARKEAVAGVLPLLLK